MPEFLLPAAYALFLWWFSTGVVFYLDGLPRRTFVWSLTGVTLVLLVALYGARVSAPGGGTGSVYLAFTCGLLAWVWIEATYYLGYLTGPRKHRCEEGCSGWRHFGHALQTSLYHEAAIVLVALTLAVLVAGAPNRLALWTFLLLMLMHQSARLNVFLGVRNLNEQLLPEHLSYLKSFLRRRPMNFLFPVSVTAATIGAIWLAAGALGAGSAAERTAHSFLAALMIVGVLEHWFLVLPMDVSALWRWSLGSRGRSEALPAPGESAPKNGPTSVCAGRL